MKKSTDKKSQLTKNKTLPPQLTSKKGALILEYSLLLVACVSVAMLIQQAVSLDDNLNDSGWIIRTWMAIIETIANDT